MLVPTKKNCNMERIGLTASEEMSFENIDGRRTPDTCINYKLTYELTAQVSLKVYPCKPQSYYLKVGSKGCRLHRRFSLTSYGGVFTFCMSMRGI